MCKTIGILQDFTYIPPQLSSSPNALGETSFCITLRLFIQAWILPRWMLQFFFSVICGHSQLKLLTATQWKDTTPLHMSMLSRLCFSSLEHGNAPYKTSQVYFEEKNTELYRTF